MKVHPLQMLVPCAIEHVRGKRTNDEPGEVLNRGNDRKMVYEFGRGVLSFSPVAGDQGDEKWVISKNNNNNNVLEER